MTNIFSMGFGLIGGVIWLFFAGVAIYILVLFIKLVIVSIKALEVYIRKNERF